MGGIKKNNKNSPSSLKKDEGEKVTSFSVEEHKE